MALYDSYQKKGFYLERTGIEVARKCTLKCRLCGAYTPYHTDVDTKEFSLKNLMAAIDRYFKIVDYVGQFSITGGEPLLCWDLAEFIDKLNKYSNCIGFVSIFTNGTIVPVENLLQAAKNWGDKLRFIIDDYGPNCSSKTNEINTLLTNYGIQHEIRNYTKDDPHCGGWFDCGNLKKKKLYLQTDIENLYKKCIQSQILHFCFTISGRYMWPCSVLQRCHEFGVVDDNTEYIDLFDDGLPAEEQRKKIEGIYQKKFLSACAYCNGMCEDSPRVTPAQQLTNQEMMCVKAGASLYSEVQSMIKHQEI